MQSRQNQGGQRAVSKERCAVIEYGETREDMKGQAKDVARHVVCMKTRGKHARRRREGRTHEMRRP